MVGGVILPWRLGGGNARRLSWRGLRSGMSLFTGTQDDRRTPLRTSTYHGWPSVVDSATGPTQIQQKRLT